MLIQFGSINTGLPPNIVDQLMEAEQAAKCRYIQIGGKLSLLPMDPISFLKTSILSTKDKLRLIQGFFIKNISKDQSVFTTGQVHHEIRSQLYLCLLSELSGECSIFFTKLSAAAISGLDGDGLHAWKR